MRPNIHKMNATTTSTTKPTQLNAYIVELCRRAALSVKHLAAEYHNGGLWSVEYPLTGYCGIASRFLVSVADVNGIGDMELIVGLFDDQTHCWVEYGKFCIDLTIAQFEGFEHKSFSVCRVDDRFYKQHYEVGLYGKSAVEEQRTWKDKQRYEDHSIFLWHIYRNEMSS